MGGASRLAGFALTAALGLAGCGGDTSGAAVLPRRSTPTAVVASPTPSLTTAQIAAEAVAFVKSYYAEINHAIATGDTTRLRAMQTENCVCRDLTANIARLWSDGRIQASGLFTVKSFTPKDVYAGVASVVVKLDGLPYDVIAHGRTTHTDAKPGLTQEVEAVREGARWRVSHVRSL